VRKHLIAVPTLSILITLATLAAAQDRTGVLFDFAGYGKETGGIPPSNPGDELFFCSIVDGFGSPLTWDPTKRYSAATDDLISLGQTIPDPHNIVVEYSNGRLVVFESDDPAAPCGNGIEYLVADFTSFILCYNSQFHSGAIEANLIFTGGEHLHELEVRAATLWGGVFVFGYDLQFDGQVLIEGAVSVEPDTWGSIKASFKQ